MRRSLALLTLLLASTALAQDRRSIPRLDVTNEFRPPVKSCSTLTNQREGALCYDTSRNALRYFNGSSWNDVDGAAAASSATSGGVRHASLFSGNTAAEKIDAAIADCGTTNPCVVETDGYLVTDDGSHTGSSNAAILTDNTQSWTTNSLVNYIIRNTTDGSEGAITANTATTITATLANGTDNDWDNGDQWLLASWFGFLTSPANVIIVDTRGTQTGTFVSAGHWTPYYSHLWSMYGKDNTNRSTTPVGAYQESGGLLGLYYETWDGINYNAGADLRKDTRYTLGVESVHRGRGQNFGLVDHTVKTGTGDGIAAGVTLTGSYGICENGGDECSPALRVEWNREDQTWYGTLSVVAASNGDGSRNVTWKSTQSTDSPTPPEGYINEVQYAIGDGRWIVGTALANTCASDALEGTLNGSACSTLTVSSIATGAVDRNSDSQNDIVVTLSGGNLLTNLATVDSDLVEDTVLDDWCFSTTGDDLDYDQASGWPWKGQQIVPIRTIESATTFTLDWVWQGTDATAYGAFGNRIYSNATCSSTNLPYECCTGSGTGTCNNFRIMRCSKILDAGDSWDDNSILDVGGIPLPLDGIAKVDDSVAWATSAPVMISAGHNNWGSALSVITKIDYSTGEAGLPSAMVTLNDYSERALDSVFQYAGNSYASKQYPNYFLRMNESSPVSYFAGQTTAPILGLWRLNGTNMDGLTAAASRNWSWLDIDDIFDSGKRPLIFFGQPTDLQLKFGLSSQSGIGTWFNFDTGYIGINNNNNTSNGLYVATDGTATDTAFRVQNNGNTGNLWRVSGCTINGSGTSGDCLTFNSTSGTGSTTKGLFLNEDIGIKMRATAAAGVDTNAITLGPNASNRNVLVLEGTDDTSETTVNYGDPTGDRTVFIPGDADSSIAKAITCSGSDKVTAFNAATGAFTCGADLGSGAGTDVQVDTGGVLAGVDFQDGGDVNFAEAAGVVTGTLKTASVSYAEIQDVSASDVFLGRDTAGAGDIEEISAANARTILNVENGATADMTAGEIEAIVNHDNLLGFVAAEHYPVRAVADCTAETGGVTNESCYDTSGAGAGIWYCPSPGNCNGAVAWVRLDDTAGTGAPTTATYITQTADGGLSAEQALGALATGIMKSTTTTGVVSIAVQGTDYYAPAGTDVAVTDGGTGAAPGAADQVLVSDSTSAATWKSMPTTGTNGCSGAGEALQFNTATNTWTCVTGLGAGGSSIILDLADDASNESTALAEIATVSDTNAIFTEPSADKLKVDLTKDWPNADTADDLSASCLNCIGTSEINESSLSAVPIANTLDCTDCVGPTQVSTLTLGSDTSGNYVASITDSANGIDGSALGVGAVYAPSIDLTETTAVTWANNTNATFTHTYDVTGTDPVLTFSSGDVDFSTTVHGTSFIADDVAAEPGNLLSINDNETAFTNDPTCANSGTAGSLTVIDVDESATDNWQICDGTSILFDIPSTGSDIIANNEILVGSGTGTAAYVAVSGDATIAAGVVTLATKLASMYWGAGAMSSDSTQCTDPAERTINSGPKLYTVICADNDGSTIYGTSVMPDGWDGGTVTLELNYVQTAADTSALDADATAQCRGAGEAISSTWGTEVDITDAAVTGSNAVDQTTSAAITPAGTCAAGDFLAWRIQLNAAGTTTAVATLHLLGVKMEYSRVYGD